MHLKRFLEALCPTNKVHASVAQLRLHITMLRLRPHYSHPSAQAQQWLSSRRRDDDYNISNIASSTANEIRETIRMQQSTWAYVYGSGEASDGLKNILRAIPHPIVLSAEFLQEAYYKVADKDWFPSKQLQSAILNMTVSAAADNNI